MSKYILIRETPDDVKTIISTHRARFKEKADTRTILRIIREYNTMKEDMETLQNKFDILERNRDDDKKEHLAVLRKIVIYGAMQKSLNDLAEEHAYLLPQSIYF